ncbi:S26 family signal peptidase [Streptomyces sp. NPDC001852]|uniref:S26 family signal peptidase n=1 Tax=Streptomyces sp. NPDC001852 TaxID=3364619 RepID=UPI0036C45D51
MTTGYGRRALVGVCCLGAAWAVLRRSVIRVTVRGVSMEPTYHDGDRLLARRGQPLLPSQAVVVEQPRPDGSWPRPPISWRDGPAEVRKRTWMIKRVAALPGDPVPRDEFPALSGAVADRVPWGTLLVLGDNREVSADSRVMGFLPVQRVLGVVHRASGHTRPARWLGALPARDGHNTSGI